MHIDEAKKQIFSFVSHTSIPRLKLKDIITSAGQVQQAITQQRRERHECATQGCQGNPCQPDEI